MNKIKEIFKSITFVDVALVLLLVLNQMSTFEFFILSIIYNTMHKGVEVNFNKECDKKFDVK